MVQNYGEISPFFDGLDSLQSDKVSVRLDLYSSRRMGILITGLPEIDEDTTLPSKIIKGPKVDGEKKAIEAFMSRHKITKKELLNKEGKHYIIKTELVGKFNILIELGAIVGDIISNYRWPQSMKWEGYDIEWIPHCIQYCVSMKMM